MNQRETATSQSRASAMARLTAMTERGIGSQRAKSLRQSGDGVCRVGTDWCDFGSDPGGHRQYRLQ